MTKPTLPVLSRQIGVATVWLLCVALLSSCAAIHDPVLEEKAFAVNEDLTSFFVTNKYKQKKVPYSAIVEDYNRIEASLDILMLRSRLADNNEKVIGMVEEIREDFRDLRTLHQEQRFLMPDFVEGKFGQYEILFFSLLKAIRSMPKEAAN